MRSLTQSLLCFVAKLLKCRFARYSIALLVTTACTPVQKPTPPSASLSRHMVNEADHSSSFTLSFDVPTPGWKLSPVFAYQVGDEIWCIHQLTPSDGMVAQVISKLEGSITLFFPTPNPDPTPTIRHYILGKTWNWNSDPKLFFLKSIDDIADRLKTATPLKIVAP